MKKRKFISAQSLRVRLTFFYVLLLAAALISFSAVLYNVFTQQQQEDFDAALYNYATDIAQGVDIDFFGNLRPDPSRWDDRKFFPFPSGESYVQIVDARTGRILVRSASLGRFKLPAEELPVISLPLERASVTTVKLPVHPSEIEANRQELQDYRLINYPILGARPLSLILQVGVPMNLLKQQKRQLLSLFLIGVPLTLFISAVLGFYVSHQGLAPLKEITRKAKRMGAEELSERLPVPGFNDELRSLSMTLNDLLERLEKAFTSQERFIADASHQLKTPLAILKGELDLLKSRSRTPEEYQAFVASASQELSHLTRMVDELLILARVDAGQDSFQFHSVRLDDLLVEAVARLQPLAEKAQLQLRLNLHGIDENEEFEIQGDPDLLKTAVQNLIDNAIRHATPDSAVELTLESSKNAFLVRVFNYGSVIPEESRAQIFDRFFRSDANQSKSQHKGVGLGLAIVKRVVEAHGGRALVESRSTDGTLFTLELPKQTNEKPGHRDLFRLKTV